MSGDEVALVNETFASNWIAPLGPQVDAFERELSVCMAVSHTAALSSGTAALHLALRWLDLQPGDEVLCSTLTFSASVNPVLYERATPVFVDSDERSWNMDPARLNEAIADGIRRGKKPKAVILVHLYGQSADLDPIEALCREHEIPLIEDAAEALGAIYYSDRRQGTISPEPKTIHPESQQRAHLSTGSADHDDRNLPSRTVVPGSVGLCGILSFNGNKIITTSSGGALVSQNAALVEKAKFWATQARDPAPHYQHSEVGFNYRMSNVLAAIGRGQLRVLEARVNARRSNCSYYQGALGDLPGLHFMPEATYGRSTRWLTCLTVDPTTAGTDREKIRLALEQENIESRPVWKPMHLQPIFKGFRCYGSSVSERLFEQGLCLPSGSNLTKTDLDRVIDAIRQAYRHI